MTIGTPEWIDLKKTLSTPFLRSLQGP